MSEEDSDDEYYAAMLGSLAAELSSKYRLFSIEELKHELRFYGKPDNGSDRDQLIERLLE